MEILIITEDSKTESQLIWMIDQIIVEEKLRNLDIVWEPSEFSFANSDFMERHLFLLFDIRNLTNVQEQCYILKQKFPYSELGIVSSSYQQAVTLVNSMHGIAGCIAIEESKWEVQLLLLLHQLDKKEIAANRALLLNQNGVHRIVPYDAIDYIETVKGQHYCMVNYNRKQVKIRGSISKLRVVLDDSFVRVKSSVIVNVSNIEVLYRREHMILFRNGECCYFSKGFEKSLLNQIRMHTIHV